MIAVARNFAAFFLLLASSSGANAQAEIDPAAVARGEYLLQVSGCVHCHTADGGEPLAGGRALETPFGIFYAPNISSHASAGIGNWSLDQFNRALRHGESPQGDAYYPAFPFTAYTRITAADASDLYAYIRSRPASDLANREHDLDWFLGWRFAARVWQWLFFSPGEFEPRAERSAQWNRGAYIAEALGHCQECHTPRNLFGALQTDLAYAGTVDGPEGELVPNITPHGETGIGDWSRESLRLFLQFGELPNGEYTAGTMDAVIQGLNKLTEADREALIDYLQALTPIDNKVSN